MTISGKKLEVKADTPKQEKPPTVIENRIPLKPLEAKFLKDKKKVYNLVVLVCCMVNLILIQLQDELEGIASQYSVKVRVSYQRQARSKDKDKKNNANNNNNKTDKDTNSNNNNTPEPNPGQQNEKDTRASKKNWKKQKGGETQTDSYFILVQGIF